MKYERGFLMMVFVGVYCLVMFGCGGLSSSSPGDLASSGKMHEQWRAVHFLSPGKNGVDALKRAIEQELAPMGVNVIIFEPDYGFEFKSHPELAKKGGIDAEDARELVAVCRKHGIRLIPQFNCLGHQSWAKETFPLLIKYPQ